MDYRGEIGVILFNTTDKEFHVIHGERVAQISAYPTYQINWKPVTALGDTARGTGGFGSTGK